MEKDLSNYRLFASGELHHEKGNSTIELSLFKYLYYHANVRVLMLERGYAECIMVNKYIENGDKHLLDFISYYDLEKVFYKKLRDFYLSLPENDRFIVYGIDSHDFPDYTLYAIPELIPGNKLHAKPLQIFNYLYQHIDINDYCTTSKESAKLIDSLISYMSINEALIKEYFENNYLDFLTVIEAYKNYKIFRNIIKDISLYPKREIIMSKNILKLYEKYPTKNYFGQFGHIHIFLDYMNEWLFYKNYTSMLAPLNRKPPFENKICSILIYYEKYQKKLPLSSFLKNGLKDNLLIYFKDSTERNSITIYKMNGENTPLENISKKEYQYFIYNNCKKRIE